MFYRHTNIHPELLLTSDRSAAGMSQPAGRKKQHQPGDQLRLQLLNLPCCRTLSGLHAILYNTSFPSSQQCSTIPITFRNNLGAGSSKKRRGGGRYFSPCSRSNCFRAHLFCTCARQPHSSTAHAQTRSTPQPTMQSHKGVFNARHSRTCLARAAASHTIVQHTRRHIQPFNQQCRATEVC